MFLNANVFRLSPAEAYTVVWAGGLFDYLTDRQAVTLLRKMWRWTRTGGSLTFANFLPSNNSKLPMEWWLRWFLKHRSRDDMIALTSIAGIPQDSVSYSEDNTATIGFCTCMKA
jgi:hypothetical protein